MDKINQLKELIAQAEKDAEKFTGSGNKAAGTRVRKAMLDIGKLAKEIRTEVQEMKNSEN